MHRQPSGDGVGDACGRSFGIYFDNSISDVVRIVHILLPRTVNETVEAGGLAFTRSHITKHLLCAVCFSLDVDVCDATASF